MQNAKYNAFKAKMASVLNSFSRPPSENRGTKKKKKAKAKEKRKTAKDDDVIVNEKRRRKPSERFTIEDPPR